jgi:queuine tRNA-ribosyltransferase
MPVGTRATVKGMTTAQLADLGAQVLLANTYHLFLRPGSDIVRDAGGLHTFMNWDRAILTDSGGFQIFSLADTLKVADEGADSVNPGRDEASLTPEDNMRIQNDLGADIITQLDECPPYPPRSRRGHCQAAAPVGRRCSGSRRDDQALFGIVQGVAQDCSSRRGALPTRPARLLIGGSRREPPSSCSSRRRGTGRFRDKPHTSGWATLPRCQAMALASTCSTACCRHGPHAWHRAGGMNANARNARDFGPLGPDCTCSTCTHSRAYPDW